MDYLDVDTAISRRGLRLVLTAGVPGPWGESAKNLFFVKKLSYAAVRQTPGPEDPKLIAWTRQSSAPVAMYDDERPRSGWSEIVSLAERLAPTPQLVPTDAAERAMMFGLLHELAGEHGLGWSRRLMMISRSTGPNATIERGSMPWKYGLDDRLAVERAAQRVDEILAMFAARIEAQRELQRSFLVGETLSAVDLYWAAFATMVAPMPEALCPMPDFLRSMYDLANSPGSAAVPESLIAHRDAIYRDYLELPLAF